MSHLTADADERGPAVARAVGSLAPVVTLGAIFLAILVSDSFTWATSALSDLGVVSETALVFNGGLVAGGLLGLAYSYALWRAAADLLARATAATVALAVVLMGLVGVFVSGHPLHFPVALGFYLLVTVSLVLDGAGRWSQSVGKLSAALGVAHLAGWVVWVVGPRFGTGLAVPETVGAFVFAAWVLFLSPVALGRELS
ncbi:hypothetical membrane protein [Halogranum gelatinilyticum]|uniref:Hypothetical membrane protein n=1 Tax=Halogranum gelatinilyticum TaxID=660521 RepID=A0A1G9RHB8_9EURY|nr:DUF998 domain-containing protein [Halogranum gelatinilyticum]SDM21825.1 hypothetical membrane protein [Halogranum gelatinilyticum]